MIGLLIANWRYVMMALLLAAVAFYRWDAQRWEKKYYTFEAQVKVLGEAAKEKAKAQEMADKLRKDIADAENATTVARLTTTIKRLRDQHASTSLVPAAAPGASRPELACFDRPLLIGALRRFEEGVEGLVGEGDQATVSLNTAKEWAQKR